jgi:cardiolipin synthase (CMP-forming)
MPILLHAIPNAFSATRVVLGLAFPLTPADWRPWLIVAAALSDALDGWSARWLKAESDTGRLLDPVADKVFVLALAGTLIGEGALDPVWALGLATRDLVVLAGLVYTISYRQWSIGRKLRPSWLGKCTTAAQFAVLLVLVVWGTAPGWVLAGTTGLSILAALGYARTFWRLHSAQANPPPSE